MKVIGYVLVFALLTLLLLFDVVVSRFPVRHEKFHKDEDATSEMLSDETKGEKKLQEPQVKTDEAKSIGNQHNRFATSVPANGQSWTEGSSLKSSFGSSRSLGFGGRWNKMRQTKGKRRYFRGHQKFPLIRRRRLADMPSTSDLEDEDIDAISRVYKENPNNAKPIMPKEQRKTAFSGYPDELEHKKQLENKEQLMETIVKLAAQKEEDGNIYKGSSRDQSVPKSKQGKGLDTDGRKFTCKSEILDDSKSKPNKETSEDLELLNRDALDLESQLMFLDRPQSDSQSTGPRRSRYRKPFRGYFGRFAQDIEASVKNRRQGPGPRGSQQSEKSKRHFRTLNRMTSGFSPMVEATPRRYQYPARQSTYNNAIDYLRRKPFIERAQSEFQQEEPQVSGELELQLVDGNDLDDNDSQNNEEHTREILRLSANRMPKVEEQSSSTRKLKHLLRKQEAARRIQRHVAQQIAQHRHRLKGR